MLSCTDQDVVKWLLDGSPSSENKAIECLYRRLLQIFRPWVFSRNGSNEDVHDAVTEAVIGFVQKFRQGKYQEMGKLENLLFRIAQRRFIDLLRTRGAEIPVDPLEPIGSAYDGEEEDFLEKTEREADESAKHSKLAHCLEKIGERCKERLIRFWYMKQSHEEIANAMGDSSTAVSKVMKNKCQDKLEKCMNG